MTPRTDEPRPDEAGIEELLQQVGARDEPSAEMQRDVFSAVHAEWRTLVDARQKKRRIIAWSMAASFALVVLIATLSLRTVVAPAQPIATVARVEGELNVDSGSGVSGPRRVGEHISTNERIETDAVSRAALTIAPDISVRLDHDTIVAFATDDRVTLEKGALYVDAPPSAAHTALTIDAEAGSVTHIGTQYAVRETPGGIEVSVREGRVLVTNSAGTSTGVAGEQLHVTSAGEVTRVRISANDDLWSWAESAVPLFDINDRSLASFLTWIARETGRQIVYETTVAEAAAREARLHGSIEGLDLDTALATVLSTTQLRQYPAGNDRIGIRLATVSEARD